ncbi:MAG: alpha/beta hydrolase, partial [Opitutales bacterium]
MQTLWIFFLSLLGAVTFLYLLAVLGVFLFQHRLIYVPSRTLWRTPTDVGLPHEEVFLTAEDGVHLHGWFIRSQNNHGTVLFFHGNAGNIAHRIETAQMFHRWGLNTFLIDYRGYGNSGGKPSEAGTRLDADAAWEFLVKTKNLLPPKIVVLGRSLGSAVAADLVARVRPGAAILESGLTTLADLGASIYPWLPIRT